MHNWRFPGENLIYFFFGEEELMQIDVRKIQKLI